MVTTYSPHRGQDGPTVISDTTPYTPFKRSNSGLSSMEVPRHTPSPVPQTRATTRRQGTLMRTRSSPSKVALEISSINHLNCTSPSASTDSAPKPPVVAEPFKGRQLRGRGIENVPGVSSPLKRREVTSASDNGDFASPRVKRRSQDGISSSRSTSPNSSGSESPVSTRSKTTRASLLASVGKALSHTPKKPTTLKKVVNTNHHFEKPKVARSRMQTAKPPLFNVSTPQDPSKLKRITSFDNFVSPAPRTQLFPQSARGEPVKASTPFSSSVTTETPFKRPLAAPQKPIFGKLVNQHAFATPQLAKPAQPNPAAFMSTGLLTKKNRPNGTASNPFVAPETPCKRPNFMTRKPTMVSNAPPASPFATKARGRLNFARTDSFASIADSGSPEASQGNSQNEFPPTPTKRLHPSDSSGSLRGLSKRWKTDHSFSQESFGGSQGTPRRTPQTPQGKADAYDLDASSLSISGKPAPPSFGKNIPSTPRSSKDLFGNLAHTPDNSSSPNKSFDAAALEQTMTPVMDRTSKTFSKEWDPNLEGKFAKVTQIGSGAFSYVFEVEESLTSSQCSVPPATPDNSSENDPLPKGSMPRRWAVKRVQFHGQKDRDDRIQEVEILKSLGKHKNVIGFFDSWETPNMRVYIQTEFCQLGGLDGFLSDYGNHGRMDPFRIWKIFTEITEGLDHIHKLGLMHLDIKPSNVLVAYDGVLKIADFGMAAKVPASSHLEREGDREYLAPEVLQRHQYGLPADIFSLGLTLLEISANVQLPDNGPSWQKLRSGDLSEIPDISSDGLIQSCVRDNRGFPLMINDDSIGDIGNESFDQNDSFVVNNSHLEGMLAKFEGNPYFKARNPADDLANAPQFIQGDSLKYMINWLTSADPSHRPSTDDILSSSEVMWIMGRRRSGALVYEGEWGPAEPNGCLLGDPEVGNLSGEMKLDDDNEDWIMMD